MKISTKKTLGKIAACLIPAGLAFITALGEQEQEERMERILLKM